MASDEIPSDPLRIIKAALGMLWLRLAAWAIAIGFGFVWGSAFSLREEPGPIVAVAVACMQIWGIPVLFVALGGLWQLVVDSEGSVGWIVLSAASATILAMASYEFEWQLAFAGTVLVIAALYWNGRTARMTSAA